MRKQVQFSLFLRGSQHDLKAACIVPEKCRDHDQSDHDGHGLDHIGQCHRPHPAEQRIDRDNRCPDHDRLIERQHRRRKEHIDHESQRRQLSTCPTQIRGRDAQ